MSSWYSRFYRILLIIGWIFVLSATDNLYAQLTIVQGAEMGMTPEQLVQNWLVGQGVTISNVTFNGSSDTIASDQIGSFTCEREAYAQLKLDAGIIMTSGLAVNAIGPNNICGTTATTGSGSDPDLTMIAGIETEDKAVLEFDFVPESDTIKFRYIFGSEEIWKYCHAFNDAFGFFLSGPGISDTFSNNATNIALMPGTSNWVTLNNMCDDSLATWCNSPIDCAKHLFPPQLPPPSYSNCEEPLAGGEYLQYNGFTYVFTAWHVVIPCSTYHIKLAIADANDDWLDSGVFLEKNSFSAPTLTVQTTYSIPALGNRAIEGCSDAILSLTLPQAVSQPYTVHFSIDGTAINGTDYAYIPDSVTFPTGSDSITIEIQPFFDGTPEGTETVIIGIIQNTCTGATSINDTILIYDNTILEVLAGSDTSMCLGDSIALSGTAVGGQRPYDYTWVGFAAQDSMVTVSPPLGTHQYILTVTDGCGAINNDTMQVLVKPLPSLILGPVPPAICSEETIQIPVSGSLPGSVTSWITNNPGGNITGHTSGTGSLVSQTLINLGYTIDSVQYLFSVIADGCPGVDSSVWITVNPIPDIAVAPTTAILCSGEITLFTMTSSVAGCLFSWTSACPDPAVSGYSNGMGSLIQQTLVNSGTWMPTVTYTITPYANNCTGIPDFAAVTVNPLPVVSFIPCFDTITTTNAQPIRLRGNSPLGGTFTGTGVYETGGGGGGGGGGGSTWYFNPALAGPGTHEITYTYTNDFGCIDSASLSIINYPLSIINCGDTLLDIRDSSRYPTVQIGAQCWMAANLNYGNQIPGSVPQRDNCIPEKYCYNDTPEPCALSSALYQWEEMMQYNDAEAIQGLCPPGWHIPTEAEWNTLFANFISNGFAGNALKYTGYSGFNALLTGIRFQNLVWKFPSSDPTLRSILFWSSTIHGTGKAWAHGMNEVVADIEYTPGVSLYPALVSNAFAVRCIRD